MPSLLLVGEWSGPAAATLATRGYRLVHVDGPGEAAERATDAACAVVRSGPDDVDAVAALDDAAPAVPVLYAVEAGESGRIESALAAGAHATVSLAGEGATRRLLDRVARFAGTPEADDAVRADGDAEGPARVSDGGGNEPGPSRETRDSRGSERGARHDGDAAATDCQIRTLLECAGSLMDADTESAVADIAVTAAEDVLGYDVVSFHVLEDDGEVLRPIAQSERSVDLVGELPPVPTSEAAAGPAIRTGDSFEVDPGDVVTVDADGLECIFVVPLGSHAVLSVATADPVGFDDTGRQMVELLGANATAALDRIERVERIEGLHHATQSMLDAETAREVAAHAVEAAESVLGFRFVGLHLYDEETDALEAVAWTPATEREYGVPRPIHAGEGGPWDAYEEGRLVHYDRNEPDACQENTPFESQLHVPLGDQGVMVVAAHERGVFDESDVQSARLLATNAARTLDRVERTQELERYESVFETVSDMVYVLDDEGRFTHVTPAVAERFGYRRGELIGAHVSEVIDDTEAISRAVDHVQELLGEPPGASRTQRFEVTAADGEELPVSVDISLLPGDDFRGVVGTIRDLSDLEAVRERLDSQQNRFEYLFEHIPDPVVEVDLEGDGTTVVSANSAFEDVFGFDADAIVGEPLNDVIVPESERERAAALDRQTAGGEIVQAELQRETQYGVREFLFRGVPYKAGDGNTRAFGIYTDITDQRERERHLEVLQRVLRHNVRNDVNVLLGGLEQLEDDDADPEVLEILRETAEGLLAMSQKAKRIGHVLEAEREQRDTVDLADLARTVVERYRAAGVDATFETDLPASAPVAGSRAIQHALEDLVGNGVEHAGDSPTVSVSIQHRGERTAVTVADDGPGIPEEERAVLEEAEITPLRHGSGLGLWLVKHATAASGGTVTFGDGDHGGGSVTLSFRTADGAD